MLAVSELSHDTDFPTVAESEALARTGEASIEWKLDGARVQSRGGTFVMVGKSSRA